MAEHSSEMRNGHLRTTVKIEPTETVKLCRCFASKNFPFCDEAHKTLDNEEGPVVVIVKQETDTTP